MRRYAGVIGGAALLVGCGPGGLATHDYAPMELRADISPSQAGQFAYTHTLGLSMLRSSIRLRFERARDQCLHGVLDCRLLAANIDLGPDNDYASSTADLSVTLPHANVDRFEDSVIAPVAGEVPGEAKVGRRSTSAENIQQEVDDDSHKLAQLNAYHDRLAALLKRPGLSVDDLIKIEAQLSQVENDLDDLTSKSRDAGDRLKRDQVTIALGERESVAAEAVRPVTRVLRNAVPALGESTASAIDFVIRAIPWLPILAAFYFLARSAWRRLRKPAPS